MQEVGQPPAHDDFLVLAVVGKLALDVKIKELLELGLGVGSQQGGYFAEVEKGLARTHQFFKHCDSSARFGSENELGGFIAMRKSIQLFEQAAQARLEDLEIEFGKEVRNASVLPMFEEVTKEVQFRAKQENAHINKLSGFTVRAKPGN